MKVIKTPVGVIPIDETVKIVTKLEYDSIQDNGDRMYLITNDTKTKIIAIAKLGAELSGFTASDISFIPSRNLTKKTVQEAIIENNTYIKNIKDMLDKHMNTIDNTVYTHPTTSGNKHIPSGGSSGQILRWSADGTAVWGADNNTIYTNFVKSGTGAKAGLVPAPSTTAGTTKYLREDGTWTVPPNTWRGIQDNLTSTSATESLSANQGKNLKTSIDNKIIKNSSSTAPTTQDNGSIWLKEYT